MKREIRTFEDLEVWKASKEMRMEIFELVKSFPNFEVFRLADQMIRSSRSISDNISEGYGRYHFQENIQYCRQARGSAYELLNQIITAEECGYIEANRRDELSSKVITCIKLLNGFIKYLQNAKSQ
jgi:four helix bundle protein